jgi:hypothetical protein
MTAIGLPKWALAASFFSFALALIGCRKSTSRGWAMGMVEYLPAAIRRSEDGRPQYQKR